MKIFCGISKRRNKDQMKRYGKYIRPCWYAFILGPLLMLTEVAGEVLLPSFMADIINVGAANHDVGYILQKGSDHDPDGVHHDGRRRWRSMVLHRLRRSTSEQGFEKDAFKKSDLFVFGDRPVLHGLSGYASDQRYHTGAEPDHDGASNDASRPRHADRRDYYGVLMDRELAAVFLIVLPVMTVVILFAFTHCISEI